MNTLIAVVAVAAAGTFAVLAFLGLPAVRSAILGAVDRLQGAVVFLCRLASAAADFFLSPRGRRIAGWKYAIWIAVNLLPLGLTLAAAQPAVADALPPGLPLSDLGYLMVAAALFQVLVVGAALIANFDDYDIMDEIVALDRRRINGVRAVAGLPVVLIGLALFFLYAAAILFWLAEMKGLDLFFRRPDTGIAIVDYALIALWTLPTSLIMRPIDWLLGADTRVVFNATLPARAYAATVTTIGWLLFVAFAALLLQVVWHLRRTLMELGDAREGDQHEILARARLAPPAVQGGILSAAVSLRDRDRQKRLLEAARDLGLFGFPQVFCASLEGFDEEIRHFGLERALELYRQRAPDFDQVHCEAIVRQAAVHLERGQLSVETMKRIVRLMVAVLVTKRQVVRIDERACEAMLAAITRELKLPREAPDPAYRGLLQDLRGAIMRLKEPQAATAENTEWIKRLAPSTAERRASRPDTPAPTAP